MYPSPFCNLPRRRWVGGGVRVGCGADGWRAAPGGGRRRRSPRRTRKPPASLPGTLGDGPTGQTPPGNPPPDSGALCARPLPSSRRRRRSAPGGDGTPRQPPGHFGRRPNWANAAGEPPARFRDTLRPTPALGPTATAVGDRRRRSPRRTRNPPPASRALWETAQLGKRRRGTPRQIPGHFAFAPCPWAGADGGRRRVVIQLSASGLYVDLKRSLIVVHLGQNPFQLVGCRQHGLVLAREYLLVVREQHHLRHRVVLVLAEQYAYDRVLVN